MVDGSRADTAQVRSLSAKADTIGQNLDGMLRTLMNSLAPLESGWVGKAGTSFIQVKTTVETEATKLKNALHGIGADLSTASTAMVSNDEDMSAQVTSAGAETSGITSSLRQA